MNRQKIAERLRELRGDRPLREVADAIGTTVMAVSMYERGERVPKDEIKVKIARFFDTTVDDIFYR